MYTHSAMQSAASRVKHTCRVLRRVPTSACRRMLSFVALLHLLRSVVTCPVSMPLCASTSPTCAISRWF